MKTSRLFLGASLGFALLLTGCESDNISARMSERSAAAATLKPWQKKNVERGDLAVGLTPDMVYMAIGNPTKTKRTEVADGDAVELWTYSSFFIPPHSVHYRALLKKAAGAQVSSTSTEAVQSQGTGGNSRSGNAGTGGSMEPADVQTYTLYVTFKGGKVSKFGFVAD